jgi:hypothetical protein
MNALLLTKHREAQLSTDILKESVSKRQEEMLLMCVIDSNANERELLIVSGLDLVRKRCKNLWRRVTVTMKVEKK